MARRRAAVLRGWPPLSLPTARLASRELIFDEMREYTHCVACLEMSQEEVQRAYKQQNHKLKGRCLRVVLLLHLPAFSGLRFFFMSLFMYLHVL